jgi:hypothetical protein
MTSKKFAAALLLAASMIAAVATAAYGMGGGGGGSGAGAAGGAGGAGGAGTPPGGVPSMSDGSAAGSQQATPVNRTQHRTHSQ